MMKCPVQHGGKTVWPLACFTPCYHSQRICCQKPCPHCTNSAAAYLPSYLSFVKLLSVCCRRQTRRCQAGCRAWERVLPPLEVASAVVVVATASVARTSGVTLATIVRPPAPCACHDRGCSSWHLAWWLHSSANLFLTSLSCMLCLFTLPGQALLVYSHFMCCNTSSERTHATVGQGAYTG